MTMIGSILRQAAGLLLVVLLLPPLSDAEPRLRTERTFVAEVIDGDTIVVDRDGVLTTIRLIGVATPETSRPEHPVEFYGPEAAAFTRNRLLGAWVDLAFEPAGRPGGSIDAYGRTLAYVVTADGTNFDLELVRLGYGRAFLRFPFSLQRRFEEAERAAKLAGLGLWNADRRSAWSDPSRRGKVIGNGKTGIYHLPGQFGYDLISEKNRIYFTTEDEAVKAGYRKARK